MTLFAFCTLPLKELCGSYKGTSSWWDGKCRGLGFVARVLLLIGLMSLKLYLTWLILNSLFLRSPRWLPATKYNESVISWVTKWGHLIYARWQTVIREHSSVIGRNLWVIRDHSSFSFSPHFAPQARLSHFHLHVYFLSIGLFICSMVDWQSLLAHLPLQVFRVSVSTPACTPPTDSYFWTAVLILVFPLTVLPWFAITF